MWVATAMVALLAISALVIQLGAAMIARHRASAAADLAALAAAQAVLSGPAVACRRAGELAEAGAARLDGCQVFGMDVLVTVSVNAGLVGSRAVARARAGPDPPH